MNPKTIIDNLIDSIKDGDPAEMDEAVKLARLVYPEGVDVQAPTPVAATAWYVFDHDSDAIVGPFPDQATALSFAQQVLDPHGVGYDTLENVDPTAHQAIIAANYGGVAATGAVAHPAAHPVPAWTPGTPLATVPAGSLYKN